MVFSIDYSIKTDYNTINGVSKAILDKEEAAKLIGQLLEQPGLMVIKITNLDTVKLKA